MPASRKWSPSLTSPYQNPVYTSPFHCTCYMPRPSHSWFDHPNYIWWLLLLLLLLFNFRPDHCPLLFVWCCLCNWPCGCWLGTLINYNWIELSRIELNWIIIVVVVIISIKCHITQSYFIVLPSTINQLQHVQTEKVVSRYKKLAPLPCVGQVQSASYPHINSNIILPCTVSQKLHSMIIST
jgi:hypothetical protein